MKNVLIFLLTLICMSCTEAEFHSVESFNDDFTNGLLLTKLTNNAIPYQFDYHMGGQYILVHISFKERLVQLRKDSLTEAKSLSLINLKNECSQQNLSKMFKASNVFHMTVTKRGIPMIRVTNKDHGSKTVTVILKGDDWRCD